MAQVVVQGREQRLVQQLVAQTAAEALDEGVLGRLARRDVMPVDLAVVGKGQDRIRGELNLTRPPVVPRS